MRFRWPIEFGEQKEQKADISLNQLIERMAMAGRVFSGESVTPANAMRCTTVQGIVRALTNAIGSYPVSVIRKSGDTETVVDDHAANSLLRRPNAVHAPTEFFRLAMKHVCLYGNFYALKGQGASGPIAFLRPVENPEAVAVEDVLWGGSVEGKSRGVTYRVQIDGKDQLIPQSRMLHITGGILAEDGVSGVSPVELAKQAIGICLAAEKLIAELYGNSNTPSMVLKGGEFSTEEQYEVWKTRFKESIARGETLMLPPEMDVDSVSFNPTDAQLLEMRKFQRIEIAQVYGVPPHKLADLERATFANIEEQSLEFVRDVAKPYVKLFEQAMTRDLLTDADQRRGVAIRFDMRDATEGRLKERIDAYAKAHEVGAMNPNEIRERLDLNPRTDDGGDEYVTALNMRPSNVELPSNTEGSGADGEGAGDDPAGEKSSIRAVQ